MLCNRRCEGSTTLQPPSTNLSTHPPYNSPPVVEGRSPVESGAPPTPGRGLCLNAKLQLIGKPRTYQTWWHAGKSRKRYEQTAKLSAFFLYGNALPLIQPRKLHIASSRLRLHMISDPVLLNLYHVIK